MTAPLRVVQWATGNIGAHSLRSVIEHPGMELAGVYVTSDAKAGKDAGDLCGLPPTGIIATKDADEIIALGADCVLYMPAACDYDQVCALLAAGSNVVTTRGEFHHPGGLDPALRARIDEACAVWGTSLYSTGSSPGFISEALPFAVTSLERRLDCLTINEFADVSQRPSPDMLFNLMGFGQTPEEFGTARFAYGAFAFGPTLRLTAESLGLPLDDVVSSGEVAVAREDTTIAAGVVPKGTVAAQRMTVSGMRGEKPVIRFVADWYCSSDVEPAWSLRETGWRVTVEGDVPIDVDIRFDVPLERMAETMPGLTANRAVNAVHAVSAAPPGIRTTADLPQVIARLG
jgi:4-hydroxy-tetrahydrodipicolinate reductase